MSAAVSLFLAALALAGLFAQPAEAGPVFVALMANGAGLLAAFSATTIGAFLTGTILGKLLVAVALSRLAMALAPKPKQPGIRTDGAAGGSQNPANFILGTYATDGVLVAPPMSHGSENKYLTLVVELSDVPGLRLSRLMVGDEWVEIGTPSPVPDEDPPFGLSVWELPDEERGGTSAIGPQFGASVRASFVRRWREATYGNRIMGKYEGKAWIKFYDGSQTEADPMLVGAYGGYPERPWSADMVGHGICYAIITLKHDRKLFNQIPRIRFELEGIPLYDPRKDSTVGGSGAHRWDDRATWEPTSNPMILVYNIHRGIEVGGTVWGFGNSAEEIPLDTVFAAANACDALVPDGAGGSEPAYRAGYEVRVNDEPATVCEEILNACMGQAVEVGGQWRFRVGAPSAALFGLTDDAIYVSRSQSLQPFKNLTDSFNAITSAHPSADALYNAVDAPPIYRPEWEAEDGGRRLVADLPLPTVTNPRQVQRLMLSYLTEQRRGRRHGFTLPPHYFALEPFDCFAWTSAANSYSGKLFEIEQVVVSAREPAIQIAVAERDPADYAPPAVYVSTEVPSAVVPVAPTPVAVFAAEAATVADAGGNARRPAILLAWDEVALEDVQGIWWQVALAGQEVPVAEGTHAAPTSGSVLITDPAILPATAYRIRARAIAERSEVWDIWLDVTTPDVRLQPADIGDEVREEVAATAEGFARDFGIVTVTALPAEGARENQIVLKAPEMTLHRWTGAAWSTQVFAGIAAGSVEATAFAAGIRPVEVLESLPTTGNVAGRVAMLNTDGQIYRWTGSAWTAAVPAANVTGQLTDAQIAAVAAAKLTGQITGPQIANAAVTDAKIAGVAAGKVTGQLSDAQIAAVAAAKVTGQITAPQIADQAVTDAKIAGIAAAKLTGQVAGTQIADGAISTAKLLAGSVSTAALAAGAVTADRIAANAVTAVAIAAGAIETAKIAAGAVQAAQIAAGAVTADKVAANAVTAAAIAAGAVTAGKIAAGAVTATEIAAGAVRTDRLTVTGRGAALNDDPNTQDISAWTGPGISIVTDATSPTGNTVLRCAGQGTVVTRRVDLDPTRDYEFRLWVRQESGASTAYLTVWFEDANGVNVSGAASGWPSSGTFRYFGLVNQVMPAAWTEYRISFGPTEVAKAPANARFVRLGILANVSGGAGVQLITGLRLMLKADASLIVDGAITATKIAAGSVSTAALAAGAVTADRIAANAVTAAAIAAGAVTAGKVAANAITATEIAANAVTAAKIAAGAVLAGQIAANAVTADKVAAGAITAGKIAAGAVVADSIASNAVTTAKIAAGAVTADQIAAGAVTAGKIAAGSITADRLDAASLAVAGLSVFGGDLQSAGFAAGSAGWRIRANGDAEFNNLVTRAWVQDGAVSDVYQVARLEPFGANSNTFTEVVSLTIGPTSPGVVYQAAGAWEAGGASVTGETNFEFRVLNDGIWGAWVVAATSSVTSSAYLRRSGHTILVGGFADAQFRITTRRVSIGSPNPSVRDARIVVRGLTR